MERPDFGHNITKGKFSVMEALLKRTYKGIFVLEILSNESMYVKRENIKGSYLKILNCFCCFCYILFLDKRKI